MLTVATYNLYLGADMSVVFGVANPAELAARARDVLDQVAATDFPARAAAIARLLVREQVDLVGLQEVATWSRAVPAGGGAPRTTEVWLDFLQELTAALSAAGGDYDVHACTASFRGGATLPDEGEVSVLGHNVILVRRDRGLHVTGERTQEFTHTFDIPTGIPGLVLKVARSWGWVDVEVGGRPLRFVNTHLEAWDERTRATQRDTLLGLLEDTGRPVVVVGDFNATPETVGMPSGYVDAWAAVGHGDGFTSGQRADLLGECSLTTRIDYVWARDVEVVGCRVVGGRPEDRTPSGLWPSDHAGVVADVRL